MAKNRMLNFSSGNEVPKKNLAEFYFFRQFFWKPFLIETVFEYSRTTEETAEREGRRRRRVFRRERRQPCLHERESVHIEFIKIQLELSLNTLRRFAPLQAGLPALPDETRFFIKKLAKPMVIFVKMISRFAFSVFKSNNKILKVKVPKK